MPTDLDRCSVGWVQPSNIKSPNNVRWEWEKNCLGFLYAYLNIFRGVWKVSDVLHNWARDKAEKYSKSFFISIFFCFGLAWKWKVIWIFCHLDFSSVQWRPVRQMNYLNRHGSMMSYNLLKFIFQIFFCSCHVVSCYSQNGGRLSRFLVSMGVLSAIREKQYLSYDYSNYMLESSTGIYFAFNLPHFCCE